MQQPLVVAGFITTFKDLSLLSGARAAGFACVNLATGNISLVAEGNGRFEGATGTSKITGEAEPALFLIGFPLDALAYRATGTIVYDLD